MGGQTSDVRRILVVGIGAGNPDHLTLQAVDALDRAEAFFLIDKGVAQPLNELRQEMIERHARADHRTVVVDDPPRDRDPEDYDAEVRRWHQARADRLGAAIEAELGDDGVGAILVWGDPSLYDSTLRVLATVDETVDLDVEVIPGITSVSALAAAHATALHGIGEPVLLTTGRRLTDGPSVENVVVLLDGQHAFKEVDPDTEVLWVAYAGMAEQRTIRGRVGDVADEIVAARAEAKAEHGWIMDAYLLRRPT
jgi:precorrin-6A synthase